jgi:hypothetical protein
VSKLHFSAVLSPESTWGTILRSGPCIRNEHCDRLQLLRSPAPQLPSVQDNIPFVFAADFQVKVC